MDEAALPEGGLAAAYPRGKNILLARFAGTVYAFDGKCPHMACPLFCGSLAGAILTCPCHDWRFDIRTGRFLDAAEIALGAYSAKAEGGKLLVGIPKGEE